MSEGLLQAHEETSIEVRSSAFFRLGKRFKKVYGAVGPTYEVELSRRCGRYAVWVNLDYLRDTTNRRGADTRLGILNTSFGLKYLHGLNPCSDLYVGIGPTLGWVDLSNHTCAAKDHFSRGSIGFVVKTGLYYHFCRHWFADIFCDFLYQDVQIKDQIPLGGIKLGVGLGTKF